MLKQPRLSANAKAQLAALLMAGSTFIPMSLLRLVDGDEGYLLMAARLLSEGEVPYRDFFFPQMPMVPMVFGGLFAVLGRSWYAPRILAALISTAIAGLIFRAVLHKHGSWKLGLFGTFLFSTAGFSMAWLPIVKTYGLALLFAFAAVVLVSTRIGLRATAGAGALIILASASRLYMGVVGVAAVVFVIRREGFNKRTIRHLAALAAGGIAGTASILPFVLMDPLAFHFGNIRFTRMRMLDQSTLFGPMEHKAEVVSSLLGLERGDGASSIQFVMLLLMALMASLSRNRTRNSLYRMVWVPLLVLNLLPYPTFSQYACLLIPFLTVEVVGLLGTTDIARVIDARATAVFVACYLALGIYDADRYSRTGVNVPGLVEPSWKGHWSIRNIRKVGKLIDATGVTEGASWWPGYFVTTKTPIIRSLANDFGFRPASFLGEGDRKRFHLITQADVMQAISKASPRLYVEGNWAPVEATRALSAASYRLHGQVANAKIWLHD